MEVSACSGRVVSGYWPQPTDLELRYNARSQLVIHRQKIQSFPRNLLVVTSCMITIDQDSPVAQQARLRKHLKSMTASSASRRSPKDTSPASTAHFYGGSPPEPEDSNRAELQHLPGARPQAPIHEPPSESSLPRESVSSQVSCLEQVDIRQSTPSERVKRLNPGSEPPSLVGELRRRMQWQLSSPVVDPDAPQDATASIATSSSSTTKSRKRRWTLPPKVRLALSTSNRGVLIAVALIAVVVGFFVVALSWPGDDGSVESAPVTETAPKPTSASDTTIVVSVAGAVETPGVVEVPEGARVADAIEEAGGMLDDIDPGLLNLARVLNDGDLIAVEDAQESTDEEAGSEANGEPGAVNVNAADAGALVALNGVGPVLAERIVDYRDEHGSFQAIEDLLNVSGIGPAMLEKIRDDLLL